MFDLPEELQIAWDILQEGNIPENEELIEYCYSLLSLINGCKRKDFTGFSSIYRSLIKIEFYESYESVVGNSHKTWIGVSNLIYAETTIRMFQNSTYVDIRKGSHTDFDIPDFNEIVIVCRTLTEGE